MTRLLFALASVSLLQLAIEGPMLARAQMLSGKPDLEINPEQALQAAIGHFRGWRR